MKKILFISLLSIQSMTLFAQEDAFTKKMTELIGKVSTTQPGQYEEVINSLDRVTQVEQKNWIPKYYLAYAYIMQAMTTSKKETIDGLLDIADRHLESAIQLIENDELYVLKSLSKSARIGVNPMTRGMKYGPEALAMLEKAKEINPENPRIYFLLGQNAFYTPEAFGGGKVKAQEYFGLAQKKFAQFKPSNNLLPNWGAEQNLQMLEKCK